jgi:hypothetical protein
VLLAPFLYAVLFGFLGPPVGSLVISLPLVLEKGAIGWLAVAGMGFMSYFFGLLPAMLTGIGAGFAHRLPALAFVPLCAAMGAGFSLAFAMLIRFGGEAGHSWQYMAVPGAVGATAAAICAVPLGRWLRRAGAI